jgi:predicted ester cyclase
MNSIASIEQHNKNTMNRIHDAVRFDGLTAQTDFFAEQSHNHGFPTARADIRAVLEDIQTTFPDVKFMVNQMVAENDLVFVHYTVSGTHLGVQKLPFVHGSSASSTFIFFVLQTDKWLNMTPCRTTSKWQGNWVLRSMQTKVNHEHYIHQPSQSNHNHRAKQQAHHQPNAQADWVARSERPS